MYLSGNLLEMCHGRNTVSMTRWGKVIQFLCGPQIQFSVTGEHDPAWIRATPCGCESESTAAANCRR